ncbi:uncharacterized protein BT62DRAFT_552988 [Guyanagaster necrorhizus]|uniref:Uncharacterized protein n=1 Tax=Guyanagaster necrorhizus TaxID=856835 RepID=A0A9P8AMX6_9AGAR|nr:uncharacterized protein BT62DRAFT_552988 [Guyanagaster necrorhizus MCA 3950]KAG7441171.1 hypothetical protein BT62DRAFT_552988 [Guyanagaster necrorhizus MCA 3950]
MCTSTCYSYLFAVANDGPHGCPGRRQGPHGRPPTCSVSSSQTTPKFCGLFFPVLRCGVAYRILASLSLPLSEENNRQEKLLLEEPGPGRCKSVARKVELASKLVKDSKPVPRYSHSIYAFVCNTAWKFLFYQTSDELFRSRSRSSNYHAIIFC